MFKKRRRLHKHTSLRIKLESGAGVSALIVGVRKVYFSLSSLAES